MSSKRFMAWHELLLLFILVVCMAGLSFVIGYRLGAKSKVGPEKTLEEKIAQKQKNKVEISMEELDIEKKARPKRLSETIEEALMKGAQNSTRSEGQMRADEMDDDSPISETLDEKEQRAESKRLSPGERGEYTIRVGVFRDRESAQDFTDGLSVRGYKAYLTQISEEGLDWFQVSLGRFGSLLEVKNFTKKEEVLLRSIEHKLVRFP